MRDRNWHHYFDKTRKVTDALTVQVDEAERKGMKITARFIVRTKAPHGTEESVHAAVLNIGSSQAINHFAQEVMEYLGLEDKNLQRSIAHQIVLLAEEVRAEGDKRAQEHHEELRRQAEPMTGEMLTACRQQAWRGAQQLAEDPYLFFKVMRAIRQSVVGERNNAWLVYLAYTSRILNRPVNIVPKSISSAGKSTLVLEVKNLFPEKSIRKITSMSEKALVYETDDLRHKCILLLEQSGIKREGIGTTILRTLISEGFIEYAVVQNMETRHYKIEGPIGFVSTSTADLEFQLENRVLCPQLDDSIEQSQRIIFAQARQAEGRGTSPPSLESLVALQEWLDLTEDRDADVPFATKIQKKIAARAVRIRRDFPSLLSLIKASALLHQAQRSRKNGRIQATLWDYALAHYAMADPFAAAQCGLTDRQRKHIKTLAQLQEKSPEGVSFTELAAEEDTSVEAVWQNLQTPIKRGYVINKQSARNARRGARLVVGIPIPELDLLPDPRLLALELNQPLRPF